MIKKFVSLLKKAVSQERDTVINSLANSAGASERGRDTQVARIAALRWVLIQIDELYKADEDTVEVLEEGEVPPSRVLSDDGDDRETQAERRRRLRGNPSNWGSE